jgi:hypothetical protein
MILHGRKSRKSIAGIIMHSAIAAARTPKAIMNAIM